MSHQLFQRAQVFGRLQARFPRLWTARIVALACLLLLACAMVLASAPTHAVATPLHSAPPSSDRVTALLASGSIYTPTFTPHYFGGGTFSIAAGDMNGDGALDIVESRYGETSTVYLNDGHGGLMVGAPFGSANNTQSVALGDVNGDGALDVVQGSQFQQSVVYLNNGRGGSSAGTPFGGANNTQSVALGDVNGDGALDIVQGNSGQQSVVYLNDRSGHFYTGSVDCANPPTNVRCFGTASDDTAAIALGDVNGDGALDIVQGNWLQQSRVYLNDGHGGFGAGVPFGSASSGMSIALGDVNGDGALDIVQSGGDVTSTVYLNDGSGRFYTGSVACVNPPYNVRCFGTVSDDTPAIALGDINGDGALDIVQDNNGQPSKVYLNLNDGTGRFGEGLPFSSANGSLSVALADLNGDGALDIIQGNYDRQNIAFFNDGQGGLNDAGMPFGDANQTTSIALGDVNGDGALDIVQGKFDLTGITSTIHLNDGHGGFSGASIPFGGANDTWGVAVGDVNGDGALDIIQGNQGEQSVMYLNDQDGAGHFYAGSVDCANPPGNVRCFGTVDDATNGIALGDVNGDGALDIVQSQYGVTSTVYLNDGHGNFTVGTPFGGANYTTDIALGDVNGDGALDIVQGNNGQQSVVYLNDGHGDFNAGEPFGGSNHTGRVAVGDVNGDGALDIVQGNEFQQSILYVNDGHGGFGAGVPFGGENQAPSIALGDVNGDGALDIVQGNYSQPSAVYLNTRFASAGLPNSFPEVVLHRPSHTADANFFSASDILRSTVIPITYTLLDREGVPARIRAFYSPDGGGKWYTATAASGTPTTSLTTRRYWNATYLTPTIALPDNGAVTSTLMLTTTSPLTVTDVKVSVQISHPQASDLRLILQAPNGITVTLLNTGTLPGPISRTLTFDSDPALTSILSATAPYGGAYQPVESLTRFNGLNAYGAWRLRVEDRAPGNTGTVSAWRLKVQDSGGVHVYNWGTFASGFFGESDNMVFRIEVYPSLTTQPNRVPVFQRSSASATTFPFRVRGTQVRVLSGTVPISNAIVYQLPAGQSVGAQPFTDGSGRPFRTDGQGYLQGRGQLGLGDRLVALYPITATDSYTLYATSAAPTLTGLNMYTVTQAGVQTLVISPNKPLILFNLDVSLEWDARQDTQFLTQLKYDLQRASDFLYDWTNGQAALGQIRLYHDRQQWDNAHIQIYATNRLRPNAAQGGIVSTIITDPVTSTVTYGPGQVRIGAVWDRYGDTTGSLGEDWPRALAHELGHYALFLDDDYLGLDASNHLIPIDTCTNTAMSDPYREDYSEFHFQARWSLDCANTLAAKETSRWDWKTITTFYPRLNGVLTNTGPSGLPLAVTQIAEVQPITPSTVLPVPIFNLAFNGAKVQPGTTARAILYQTGSNRLIDLGNPTLDQVNARGARLGDRLCVYDLSAQRLGCETLTAGNEELALVSKPGWQPDVLVSPVTSRTINLGINIAGLPPTLTVQARLYPIDGSASPTITLVRMAASAPALESVPFQPGAVYSHSLFLPLIMKPPATIPGYAYVGTFTLAEPAPQGTVQVWVNESGVRRETVTDYSLGGSPAFLHGRGAFLHGRGAFLHGRGAPTQSSDGQVLIFSDGLVFNDGEFFALQAVSTTPPQPAGTTLVGRAYRLSKSAGAPSLVSTSISFNYAGRDVPPGEEDFLHVYFFDGAAWQRLSTTVDTNHNVAVAVVPAAANGQGLYALLSGIELPLYGPGWNQFTYPAQGSRPVTQALASIDGAYGIVYGKSLTDMLDPWKVYAVGVPGWINDLTNLEYAQSYWISATRSITLYVTGGGTLAPASVEALPSPPATVYGPVLAGAGFTPTPNQTVTSWINGKQCGQGTTRLISGQVMYTLNILPDGPGGSFGCGAAGRIVSFKVGSHTMSTTIGWDIDRVRNLPLTP